MRHASSLYREAIALNHGGGQPDRAHGAQQVYKVFRLASGEIPDAVFDGARFVRTFACEPRVRPFVLQLKPQWAYRIG